MFLKNLIASIVISLVALNVLGAKTQFAQDQKPFSQTESTPSAVEVELQLVHKLSDRFEFELSVKNNCDRAVYILTDPVRSNGARGSYLALDPQDPSILNIAIQLYRSPDYTIYSNQTGVTLKRLEPGATHIQPITVSFPAKETSPPYKGYDFEPLDKTKLQAVRAVFGVLTDDEGVQDFVRRKEAIGIGPNAHGLELIHKGPFKGRSLIDVQEIVRTPLLKL